MSSPVRRSPALRIAAALAGTLWLVAACRPTPPDPGGAIAARTLGLVYLQENRLDEAGAEFEKVIRLAPDEALGYANLGLVALRAGRYDEAERRLERAARLDPANAYTAIMLARAIELGGDTAGARVALDRTLEANPNHAAVLYALAGLSAPAGDSAAAPRRAELLGRVVAAAPTNLAARIQLATALIGAGQADSALAVLEAIRQLPPEPPAEARGPFDAAMSALRQVRQVEAAALWQRFGELMETTAAYQASLQQIEGPGGQLVGYPVLTFRPTFEVRERLGRESGPAVRFVDATAAAGLEATAEAGPPLTSVALAAGDPDGDGADGVFATRWSGGDTWVSRLWRNDLGRLVDSAGVDLAAPAVAAAFADYDNDGRLDLYAVDANGRRHLWRSVEGAGLQAAEPPAGLAGAGVSQTLAADLDHDGDVDILELGATGPRLLRNNLDGTFRDISAEAGLAGAAARAAVFGDFDGDGLLDLFVAGGESRDRLWRNTGLRTFVDMADSAGVASAEGATAVAAADYDNDGRLDLIAAGARGGGREVRLLRNQGGGRFTRDHRSDGALAELGATAVRAVTMLDYDNDGWLDLVVGGEPGDARGGLFLFRNANGRFRHRPADLPPSGATRAVLALDLDRDGDQDLVALVGGGLRVLRNDGGNVNQYVDVRLTGLRTGSGKNNTFGVGARLELRAGDLYQTRVVTDRVTHFGLGPRLKADVLRIEWPNGVPQTVYFPGSDQDVLEQQILKGSCAFLYTWTGERYEFVTDVMWRSALGMPVGIMGAGAGARAGGAAYAPPAPSKEHLLIPGDRLVPVDGEYRIQVTEELWETAYLDQIRLVAVDHPASVAVRVDERFVPSGLDGPLRLYELAGARPPVSATDGRGNDLLPRLAERDDRYVDDLVPTRFQGITEPHELILDLGHVGPGQVLLALTGWIFPSDASINVAVAQGAGAGAARPSIEVRDRSGRWSTVIPDLGFPSGKGKTVIADLTGLFPTGDRTVRIRTGMEIYWDQAQVATGSPDPVSRTTALEAAAADLHFRGFSRQFRKGGRHGPHWFDYADVTTESPWRPIAGAFTRFGDVLPLLVGPDDRYVIMAPGDEATIRFDAAGLPALPAGWTRDFVLYTVGWIKDADHNTAFGNRVEPLPFHGIAAYPYHPGEAYPADSAHQRYRATYNTRLVTFR